MWALQNAAIDLLGRAYGADDLMLNSEPLPPPIYKGACIRGSCLSLPLPAISSPHPLPPLHALKALLSSNYPSHPFAISPSALAHSE